MPTISSKLSREQTIQEEEYAIPYHYRGLFSEEHGLLRDIEYEDYLQRVKDELSPAHGKTVLDVGCGDGRFFYELRNEKMDLVGLDYSNEAIRFAQAFNPRAHFFCEDIHSFKHARKFDFITLIEVMEHFPPEKIPKILLSLRKHLKSNGKLIVTVPSTRRARVEKHYQHFTQKTLRETLSPVFNVVEVKGYSKLGKERKTFERMRKMALLLFPFRKRFAAVEKLIKETKSYYEKNLGMGNPEECDGLMAVCTAK